MNAPSLSIAQCSTLGCLFEVTAPKPGNVHRGADFADLRFSDFVSSAVAVGPVMQTAVQNGVGATVLAAVRATRQVVSTNTNLGTILLLAPMAAVPREEPLRAVDQVVSRLTPDDARDVYEAIRLAAPGGLGQVKKMDIAEQPPADLAAAMNSAADRDLVARQYINGFADILNFVVPWIVEGTFRGWELTTSIVHAHVRMMSQEPDSLIRRKCGAPTAEKAARLAADVLDCGLPDSESYQRALRDLDFWLRSDHNRRNPGTTADLIAAGLFAILRDGLVAPPYW